MTNPRARRRIRNRRLPEPWQRLEHGLRLRMGEVNGDDLFVLDERQWVPIGPSIMEATTTRREGRLMVTGRVRDLQIDPTGSRAYAGTAKGGVWYTGDSGRTWRPVGGWTRRIGRQGGPNSVLAVGALLVHFGDNSAEDFVVVGTGEVVPSGERSDEAIKGGGVGVLAARGPARNALDEDPWEPADGLNLLEGLGVLRLARRPTATPGATGDEIVAATSDGFFRGVRSSGRFVWTRMAPTFRDEMGDPYRFQDENGANQRPVVTDLLWLPVQGNRQGRLYATFVARHEHQMFIGPPTPAYSDDGGRIFRQISGAIGGLNAERMQRPRGRASLSSAGEGAQVRVYVMGGWNDEDDDVQVEICAVDHPLAAHDAADPPTIRRLDVPGRTRRFWEGGDESRFWGTQGGYSQAITAAQFGTGAAAHDRIFLGGSGFWGRGYWLSSLWCFRVDNDDLVPIPGISSVGGTNRSFRPGHIGSGMHVDVHAIRVASGDSRKIWVGNDGGVSVSENSGQDGTFITRSDGMAATEAQYGASHPQSSSFAIFGCHDNGIMARDGDVVWREALSGDGGGVAFDPVRPHHFFGQLQHGTWSGRPGNWFRRPAIWTTDDRPDEDNSQFYSNPSTARLAPNSDITRIAVGTDRVWVNDQRGRARRDRWWVLPGHNFPSVAGVLQRQGPVRRARRSGGNLPARGNNEITFGILQLNEGPGNNSAERDGVSAVRWVRDAQNRARSLLVLINDTVYRYDQVGDPTDHRWRPNLVTSMFVDGGIAANAGSYLATEIAPVHGTNTFYLATTGDDANVVDTLFFHDGTTLRPTGLRTKITQRDPAYSVAVDDQTGEIYVGTALGVWRGVRDPADNSFSWDLIGRGLPPALVQDLHVHHPSAQSPKTLVAALASRGLWQLNLEREDFNETWIRAHRHDDRRVFPTPRDNPRRSAVTAQDRTANRLAMDRSPDIVVRPRWPRTDPPPAYPGRPLTRNRHTRYQLWTFQTAFRRFSPAIKVDGVWTRQLELDIQRFRAERSDLPNTNRPTIDRRLWNLVVVDDPTAAYEPAWRLRLTGVPMAANEADLRSVVYRRQPRNSPWEVPGEQCTVEVLIHHRDTNLLDAGDAFAILLWQWNNTASVSCDGIAEFAQGIDRGSGQPTSPSPDWTAPTATNPNGRFRRAWHVAMDGSSVLHRLPVPLNARMPRAVPINIDLSRDFGAANPADVTGPVVLLALVGSTVDPFSHTPPTTGQPIDFVSSWRHAALHTIQCTGPR